MGSGGPDLNDSTDMLSDSEDEAVEPMDTRSPPVSARGQPSPRAQPPPKPTAPEAPLRVANQPHDEELESSSEESQDEESPGTPHPQRGEFEEQ
eukprot:7387326-Prymnesium_polylepis.1